MTHPLLSTSDDVRACRTCGCTDLRACMTAEGNCYWVEDDLCSACVGKAGVCIIRIQTTVIGAELTIDGALPEHVSNRVVVIEGIVSEMAKAAGEDPAEAVMQLLVAAAHMAKQFSGGRSWEQITAALQRNMAGATSMASTWYDARDGEKSN